MNVDVETLNPCQKKLTIQLSADEVNKEFQSVIRELRQNVTLPGFRKGKASVTTIKRRFSRDIKKQVKENLLEQSMKDALVQEDISPVGTPPLDVKKITVSENQPLEYDVEVEFLPPVEITDYTGVEIKKPEVPDIPEERVTQALEALQREQAMHEPVEDDYIVSDNNSVTINYSRTLNGESLGEPVTDYTIWLGVDPIIPELHSNLLGKQKGDTVTFPFTYGEDLSDKQIAGKTVEFSVEIVDVARVILPELDDEFAKDLEQETLDDLKKRIEDDLKVRLEHDMIEASKHEILMKLADANVFDLPPSLLKEQKKNYPDREEEELAKMLRAGIILTKIQLQENIVVTDGEVDARVQQIATQNQVAVAAMRDYLVQQSGGLERVRNDLLEARTLDFLYEHANFIEEE